MALRHRSRQMSPSFPARRLPSPAEPLIVGPSGRPVGHVEPDPRTVPGLSRRSRHHAPSPHGAPPTADDRLDEHAQALELLADVVCTLPEDDERLLLLGTSVAGSLHLAQPASMRLPSLLAFRAKLCDTFLTSLVQIARDDALA